MPVEWVPTSPSIGVAYGFAHLGSSDCAQHSRSRVRFTRPASHAYYLLLVGACACVGGDSGAEGNAIFSFAKFGRKYVLDESSQLKHSTIFVELHSIPQEVHSYVSCC